MALEANEFARGMGAGVRGAVRRKWPLARVWMWGWGSK